RWIGLDLARAQTLLLLDEPLHRPLQPVDREVLERDILQRRQRTAGPPPDQRLLGLALREPHALRLDARVFAQAFLQLLLERERRFVELLLGRLVGRHQQLGLEVDERGRHHQIGTGELEVLELHRLEVGEVLVGDGPHRQRSQVDLVGAAEVKQEVEGTFEVPHAKPQLGFAREDRLRHGTSFTASCTSVMVCWAIARARREPSNRICLMVSGFSANACRRSRIFSSGGSMCLSSTSLQSRQPKAAVRHFVAHSSRSAGGVKILCRSNTGQTSGVPGSLRRLRAGSVTIRRMLARITSDGSASSMSLPYDFDILRPSVPGTFGISVSLASGSGKTGPKAALKRRATSRVSSMCGTWSAPTGTHLALYM